MRFLLILILLALVLGPVGVIAGLGVGTILLVIMLPLVVLAFLARLLSATGSAIGNALPEQLPPGAVPTGDHVRKEADGWYCIVSGVRVGPWSDRVIAENVLKVEQRQRGAEIEKAMLWERLSGERLSDAERQRVSNGGKFYPPGP